MRRNGFTLIELLVVVSLIVLLIALLMPALQRSRRSAQDAACLSNQRQLIGAFIDYSFDAQGRLPLGTRTWPHHGMLDVYEGFLRPHLGNSLSLMHCPAQKETPGGIALWWRAWYGHPMTAGDHLYLQTGEAADVDYDYYWFVKMYWRVEDNGVLSNNLTQYRTSSVKFPTKLMAQRCFVNHGDGAAFAGIQGSFIDNHAEFVTLDRLLVSSVPSYGAYNLDWTVNGIHGKDVE